MANPNVQPVANRGDPIPTLVVPDHDDQAATGPAEGTSSSDPKHRRRLSLGFIRSKLEGDTESNRPGLQDKVFGALFAQIFPDAANLEPDTRRDTRLPSSAEPTPFSLPSMSRNFRRFNARIGVVFAFEAGAIRLFSWSEPSHTLSFLAVYSFCCLNPNILIALPLVVCVLFIMVPAFISRHPPPPNSTPSDIFSTVGPALAPAPSIKPAPEMSKDFWRNMRDLQNTMEDFSVGHDLAIAYLSPITNFSDEKLSSTVFAALFLLSAFLTFAANLLPWRAIFLALGWAAVGSSHPVVQRYLKTVDTTALEKQQHRLKHDFDVWKEKDIMLDEEPEKREVEVFELQRLRNSHWESWLFSPSPYDPLTPARIAGDRPRGTRFFEDVQPPVGWVWSEKKWSLDLFSKEWVDVRMITSVEVETEGERWVYDLANPSDELPTSPLRNGAGGYKNRGEWRRRRWIRVVKRKGMTASLGPDAGARSITSSG